MSTDKTAVRRRGAHPRFLPAPPEVGRAAAGNERRGRQSRALSARPTRRHRTRHATEMRGPGRRGGGAQPWGHGSGDRDGVARARRGTSPARGFWAWPGPIVPRPMSARPIFPRTGAGCGRGQGPGDFPEGRRGGEWVSRRFWGMGGGVRGCAAKGFGVGAKKRLLTWAAWGLFALPCSGCSVAW